MQQGLVVEFETEKACSLVDASAVADGRVVTASASDGRKAFLKNFACWHEFCLFERTT